ncbi:ribonuclease III [Anaeromyxobacter sp. PSR-1]|uniref:ribonuclease III n=1 Tax=Anaeromyxobacter sp. PSR-1 TaxID=1300915 RepID=UPI0005E41082|nr:ribonuclease III [Anaeromyxobacter sp. PSR-1]GAO03270.1 ribonuclease 3 [Anaeromyxobacter sp. PSR-1]
MGEDRGPAQEPAGAPPEPDPALDPVGALEARLGIAVTDRQAALAALTHKSYVNEHREDGLQDNERLEFLGDAVIDLAVSHRLMERFPSAREGDLSKMRAAVVDEQGLAEMARTLDLGPLLRLGRGEELTGGRQKSSLLADAMEAVIAAIYHGQGLPAVLSFVDRFLGEAFARAAAGTLDRDFKTQLQELSQSRLRATPRYRVVAEHGPDHSKTFEVETDLRGEVLGRGAGRSKKDAEQAAARLALDALGRRLALEAGQAGAEPAASPSAAAAPAEVPEAPAVPAAPTGAEAGPARPAPPPEAVAPEPEPEGPRTEREPAGVEAPAPEHAPHAAVPRRRRAAPSGGRKAAAPARPRKAAATRKAAAAGKGAKATAKGARKGARPRR